MAERIFVSGPSITDREVAYVTDAVTRAWYGDAGVYHQRFEGAFAAYVGRRYAMALPSCTSAIHLALVSLGVGPGDEVIVPDVTWIASAAPVTYVGATPVFADIDARSWCLSADAVARCITPRTRAMIPVDLYGNMPDMAALLALASRHRLAVIEDAAQAIGSEYQGRRAGSFGAASVFSFHGSKTLTTGEGGMLVTDDEDLHRRALVLRDHGREPGDTQFINHEVAFKYRMSGLQAALGLAQLERIDELVAMKRRTFAWYREHLTGVDEITLNDEAAGVVNTYWMVTIVLDPRLGLRKETVIAHLRQDGIDSRPFFHPLSSLPAYAGQAEADRARTRNVVSYRLAPYGVNLPSGLDMTPEKVARVVDSLKQLIARTVANRAVIGTSS